MAVEDLSSRVIVYGDYLSENSIFSSEQIVQMLTQEPWVVPTEDSDFWLPGMGKSRHKGMATGSYINGIPFGFFAKPRADLSIALDEIDKIRIARSRQINTPPVIAAIDSGDRAFIITHLMYNVEPLSSLDLTFQDVDPRVYNPASFLTHNIRAIAHAAEVGVDNNDLHLGNLGRELNTNFTPRAIFFDFETANVLNRDLLDRKRLDPLGATFTAEEVAQLDIFEEQAVGDIATFCAHLKYKKFPMNDNELLKRVNDIYPKLRGYSYGVFRGDHFNHLLEDIYYNTPVDVKVA